SLCFVQLSIWVFLTHKHPNTSTVFRIYRETLRVFRAPLQPHSPTLFLHFVIETLSRFSCALHRWAGCGSATN
ncbi:hypothetical protein ABLN72_07405, partial [Mycobacterium tuberculosis]